MKKTLQINIAGVLFNIEEDAYNKLSTYLQSIQKYFTAFESSDEIVADIESRIAERFMTAGEADKIIVKMQDVDAVMARMGSVEDFEAMEEEVDFREEAEPAASPNTESKADSNEASKRLYRDTKRKGLGGVLAGLAHYFQFDITWMRVIFILLFLGASPITNTGISGVLLIAYIICWIAFPPNDQLEDNSKVKKFYRNPDGKVIAGVASGIAVYFGIDIALIRVLFVIFGIPGIGILAYLVLWIGAPMAASLTQKMEMKGEPVTLSNIENSIRTSQGISNAKDENTFTKILLFPFRLISMIFAGLGRLLAKLGPVARVLAGLFLGFIGLAMLFSAIAATFAFFGITSGAAIFDFGNNANRLLNEIPKIGGVFFFLAATFPGLAATLGGFSLISNKRVGTRNFWLTALALWIVGIFGLSMYGGTYMMNYSKRERVSENIDFEIKSKQLYFDSKRADYRDDINFDTDLYFEKSNTGNLEIEKILESKGRSRSNALEFAQNIKYDIEQKGDTLVFDENLHIGEDDVFRDQRVKLIVKVPEGVTFKFSDRFARTLLGRRYNLWSKYGLEQSKIQDIVFYIDNDGELASSDLTELSEDQREALRNNYGEQLDMEDRDFQQYGQYRKTFDFEDFDRLELSSSFQAIVTQADSFSIEIVADRERDINDLDIDMSGSTVSFEFEDNFINRRERVVAYITMPVVKDLDLSGASKIKLLNYESNGDMEVDISGASQAAIDVEINKLRLDATGASRVQLVGSVNKLDLSISGASSANTEKCVIDEADVEANGASRVKLGKVEKLDSDTSGASRISRN